MSKNKTIITTDTYFNLLEKDINDLMPEEILAKYNYESFIKHAKKYEPLLSVDALNVLQEFNSRVIALSRKENKSAEEARVLHKHSIGLENEIMQSTKEDENYSRKLKRAGYIDASVILVILLNIGFIVALAIIGS